MAVSIESIKKLRDITGVSMSACKSALEEAGDDIDMAIDILRKKGEVKAAQRAERATLNGACGIKVEGNKAACASVYCETDFVAMSDDFLNLVEDLLAGLLAGEIRPEEKEVFLVSDAVLKLGENLQLGQMAILEGEVLGSYVHSNKKIAVIVALNKGDESLARDIAMHIAAVNPAVISPDEVNEELVLREKAIWVEQLKAEGKNEEIVGKILFGKEKKFREENALMKQAFVKNPDISVEDLLKESGANVLNFYRFEV